MSPDVEENTLPYWWTATLKRTPYHTGEPRHWKNTLHKNSYILVTPANSFQKKKRKMARLTTWQKHTFGETGQINREFWEKQDTTWKNCGNVFKTMSPCWIKTNSKCIRRSLTSSTTMEVFSYWMHLEVLVKLLKPFICRLQGKAALAVAPSGIAAILLPGGCTAHSTFKLLLNYNETPICIIKRGTKLAKLLKEKNIPEKHF